MTLKLLDPYGNGKLVLFQVTYNRVCLNHLLLRRSDPRLLNIRQDWHAYELVFFLFLGVFGVSPIPYPYRIAIDGFCREYGVHGSPS